MSIKANEKLEDIVSTPVICTIHHAAVKLGLFDQQWHDGSYLFCGYHSTNTPQIAIAGQTAGLQVEIIPEGAPERTNPFLAYLKKGENTVSWYENALSTLSAAFAFLQEFEEKRGFLLDGALNSETRKYYNHEDLHTLLDSFSAVMHNNALTFSKKVELLAPVLTAIRRILEINLIPDELKYEESTFYLTVLKLQEHIQRLLEETDKTEEDIIPDFKLIAEHLADVLKDIHDDHQSVARDRQPIPTDEEKAAILQMLDELAHIMALEKNSKQAMQHIGRQLELCRQIWSNPAVDWQTRLDCATRAVDLISDAISQTEAAAVAGKKRHAVIPDLSRFTEEINTRLDELDKTGLAAITGPVADRFLAATNETRKTAGKPPLTKEALAAAIRLHAVLVRVTEKEDALSTAIHLYLADSDHVYAQHYLCVIILNGRIHEMKRLGR